MTSEGYHEPLERLRPETRVVRVGGKRLPEIVHSSVDDCLEFFSGLKLEGSAKAIATPILRELVGRLKFLAEVGVGPNWDQAH